MKRVRIARCNYCNKEIESASYARKYCSIECHSNYRVEHNLSNVNSRPLKFYLIRQRTWKCEICKLSEWQGKPITLELHHIDGNYRNNCLNNVQLLCPNCHSQTDNFKAKNKGNGRDYRMEGLNASRHSV